MGFKSYCWSIGTTSFRVDQLNYKNECQLRFLNELFTSNPDMKWGKALQAKYFDLLVSKDFIEDYAAIKDKDAREKTSGLADIGLVYRKTRQITPIGDLINKISLSGDFSSNNIFEIPKDSYVYLLQFLKYQINDNTIQIRPFVALLYMLSKLEYLTREEFTYLYPTCMNNNDVLKTTVDILSSRGKISVDDLLIKKMMSMDNYQEAYSLLMISDVIDESIMEQIGMNRKSGTYDRPFAKVYNVLKPLVIDRDSLNDDEKILLLKQLKEAFSKINANQSSNWRSMFKLYKNTKFNQEYLLYFYGLSICSCNTEEEFKDCFFKTWHLMKWKSTLEDYYDLNKRYFNLTDIIKYENGRFRLIEIAEYYFNDIVEKMLFKPMISKNDYEQYFTNYIEIENIYPECSKTETDITNTINSKYGRTIVPGKLEEYLKDIKNNAFIKMIEEKFEEEVLLELLDCFKTRNDNRIKELVTDDATPSTIFEYILGVIWYQVGGKIGRLEEYMHLTLDANFMPKTHAPGGEADLVFNYPKSNSYPKHDMLLEATLSESTGQRQMEWEPVSRHLETHINKTHNKYDYVLFIASQLEERTLKTFRVMKNYQIDVRGEDIGLKIIPIDVDLIKVIIEKKKNYDDLYKIFDESYNSIQIGIDWYNNTLVQKI